MTLFFVGNYYIVHQQYKTIVMNEDNTKDESLNKTYIIVFVLGIIYVILFGVFTSTYNLP